MYIVLVSGWIVYGEDFVDSTNLLFPPSFPSFYLLFITTSSSRLHLHYLSLLPPLFSFISFSPSCHLSIFTSTSYPPSIHCNAHHPLHSLSSLSVFISISVSLLLNMIVKHTHHLLPYGHLGVRSGHFLQQNTTNHLNSPQIPSLKIGLISTDYRTISSFLLLNFLLPS
jgi:hypothetical protein